MTSSLGAVDVAVLLGFLALSIGVGLLAGGRVRSLDAYLLGDRNLPWWVILGSIVATETSTATVLSVPGEGYGPPGLRFLQLPLGFLVGRLAIVRFLLPLYFEGRLDTAHEVLKRRFGPLVQRAAAVLFLVTRTLGDGLRLFLAGIVIQRLTGLSFQASVATMGAVTILYTVFGGLRSVAWNDCIQLVVYLVGGVAAVFVIAAQIPGGWPAAWEFALAHDKLAVFDFGFDLANPFTFWAGLVGGAALSLGTHGTDHMMVQRYLSARGERDAARAIVVSGVVVLAQFALFLGIGILLAAFHATSGVPAPTRPDEVFATFIIERFPRNVGLVGLLLAAILAAAMSTLSSSLNASASSLLHDLWLPLAGSRGGSTHGEEESRGLLLLTRWLTVGFGILQVAVGIGAAALSETVVRSALTIAGCAAGLLLGVFTLGVATRRVGQTAALVGAGCGLAALVAVQFALPAAGVKVAFPWYALIGATVTIAAGLAASLARRAPAAAALVALLAWCPASVGAAATAIDAARLEKIDGLVAGAIASGEMTGCVVCIGRRDGVVMLEAYGDREIEPARVPMTPDTVFDLASLTKPVATATAVMQLVEDGRLRLADPVATHLPEFAARGKEKITVHDLLTHQSGLIADNPLADYDAGPAEALRRICDLEPLAAPGAKFIYSDVNFILLGMLVERLADTPLDRVFRERIATPLGMRETGFLPDAALRDRCAPTEERDGALLRGVVHDPRAAKLGGVAGHAGLFGTATDLARSARMMLGGGSLEGARVLGPQAVDLMTRSYRVPGGGERGLGWDNRTGFSSNRSDLFTAAAFGHGGFTGTALWIDPGLDLFVIFLSSRLHPDGKGNVNPLAARIGSVAAAAIVEGPAATQATGAASPSRAVTPGIDVLARDGFRQLAGRRVGLITNHTGRDLAGVSTARRLAAAEGVTLVALFSPEHGAAGRLELEQVPDDRDPATGLPVRSLYGATRRPTKEMLAGIDTLVFDIQDIGCRFYTYISTLLEAMKAAAEHGVAVMVLDRPNPLGGIAMAGPLVDPGSESFVGCHPIPVRHGMTVGELALLFRAELGLDLNLEVVPCEGWRRADAFDATGLEWVNPSPNMRSLTEAFLYPGIGLLEMTNLSVGRGTDTPFEVVGAPSIDGRRLAEALVARRIPGVAFVPIAFTPASSKFAGEACRGVNVAITDRDAFEPVRVGLEIAASLRRLHPEEWEAEKVGVLLLNQAVLDSLVRGADIDAAIALANAGIAEFARRRSPHLIYDE